MKFLHASTLFLSVLLAPALRAENQFEILVLASPNKYHFEYIGVAHETFELMARHHQFGLTWTSDPATLEGGLKKYAAVVFLNTSGEVLNAAQRKSLEDYLHGGGGFVAVHRAIISLTHEWPWYEKLVGEPFRIHPAVQTAVVHVIDRNFPATMPLPDRWIWTDEWYEYDAPLVPDLNVVMTVDESTYDPTRIGPGQHATGMGAFHPVAWYHNFDGGRSFSTALGHMAVLYRDQTYLDHIYGGIYWAATGRGITPPK
jgi:type 1 glutamine amidotransferase